jgi:hypothetical protein
MPDLTRLAADLAAMRSGHGPRRSELRERLATIDPALRHSSNLERLRLAGLKARLRMLDTRQGPAPLQVAAEESARRLAALDLRIVAAIARQLSP